MNDYDYVYTKVRRQFGRPCHFKSTATILLNELKSDPAIASEFVRLNPSELIIDNIATLSMHSVNTDSVVTQSRGQSHSEGGWPKEIDANEPQDTSKWRKRLDKDPQFTNAVSSLCSDMKQILDQNNSIDMFQEYYEGETPELEAQSLKCSTVALFKDPNAGRTVSRICWHPDNSSRFIASYSLLKFQRMDDSFLASSYIWEVETPNTPCMELLPEAPLITTQYYFRNSDLVAGGNSLGRIEFFDLRVGPKSMCMSSYECSHADPVFDLCWLQSKTHSELVSTSTDGKVLWWDTRNLSSTTSACILSDGGSSTLSGTSLDWQQEAGPTKYLVGTEEGVGLCLTKKPQKPVEVGGWFGQEDHGGGLKHFGPIYSIKRNLFHPKYFMTVGDSCVKIWLEELKSPLLQSAPSSAQLLCGGWSRTRPGVFFTGRFDGVVDFFDYSYQMNQVAYSHKVSNLPVSSASMDSAGRLLAAADAGGTVTLIRLCDELALASSTEKSSVGAMLEREQRRERNLDTIKKQQLLAKQTGNSELSGPKHQMDEEQYIVREKQWLGSLGLPDSDLTLGGTVRC